MGPFGVVRGPFGWPRSGSFRHPFGVHAESVRNLFGAGNEKRQSTIEANLPRDLYGGIRGTGPETKNANLLLQPIFREKSSSARRNRCDNFVPGGYQILQPLRPQELQWCLLCVRLDSTRINSGSTQFLQNTAAAAAAEDWQLRRRLRQRTCGSAAAAKH